MKNKMNVPLYFFNANWLMVVRIFTASVVGYVVTILYSVLLSKVFIVLSMSQVNATVAAQLLSFLMYASFAIWVFSVTSLKKLYLHMFYSVLASVLVIYIIGTSL